MRLAPTFTALLAAGLMVGNAFALDSDEYRAERERIDAAYKSAKAQCEPLKGNAEDVCEEQAKGERKIARAELEARHKPTQRNRRRVAEARAEAAHAVAKEKCDALDGAAEDACERQARATYDAARRAARAVR